MASLDGYTHPEHERALARLVSDMERLDRAERVRRVLEPKTTPTPSAEARLPQFHIPPKLVAVHA